MMNHPLRFLSLAATVALLGCGPDATGVRAITITLAPMPEDGASIDPAILTALPLATAVLHVDVDAGSGHLEAMGLPLPPAGFGYGGMVLMAHEMREGLPGAPEAEGGGHSHGALATETQAMEGEMKMAMVGSLVPGTSAGSWERPFGASALGDGELGAIRQVMIMYVDMAGTGMPAMLMHGEAGHEGDSATAAAEEGGHSHGP